MNRLTSPLATKSLFIAIFIIAPASTGFLSFGQPDCVFWKGRLVYFFTIFGYATFASTVGLWIFGTSPEKADDARFIWFFLATAMAVMFTITC